MLAASTTRFLIFAFGLEAAKISQGGNQEARVDAASILGIESLLDRKPKALSGGQRKRVAVGRAIVRQPKVFLFDEPLSNLDAKTRCGCGPRYQNFISGCRRR